MVLIEITDSPTNHVESSDVLAALYADVVSATLVVGSSALTLAGNFLIRYLYIPTEDNPADAPSRGVTRASARCVPVQVGGSAKGSHTACDYDARCASFQQEFGFSVDEALSNAWGI